MTLDKKIIDVSDVSFPLLQGREGCNKTVLAVDTQNLAVSLMDVGRGLMTPEQFKLSLRQYKTTYHLSQSQACTNLDLYVRYVNES